MISRMIVENFKAIRHVEVDLAPITVLIGPNDSGKSSFLEAIYALAESSRSNLRECFWSPWQKWELVYKQAANSQVRLAAHLRPPLPREPEANHPEKDVYYEVAVNFTDGRACRVGKEFVGFAGELKKEESRSQGWDYTVVQAVKMRGMGVEQTDPIRAVLGLLNFPALARWDVEELGLPSRLSVNRRYPFDPSGYGLAACLAEMKLGNEERFEALRKDFCGLFPGFRGIIVKRADVTAVDRGSYFEKTRGTYGEGYALFFVRTDGVEIPAALASGGALVALAYLTLRHLPEPRRLLLVEEPENGLHPSRLKEIVDILRQAATSQKSNQVILTTHSPFLLDYVEPEEVRVFLRNEQDDIEVHNVAEVPEIRDRLKYLMLGELIYNEGEQELVKEIRQNASSHSGRRTNRPRKN